MMTAASTPSRRVLGHLDNNTALPSPTAKAFLSPSKKTTMSPRRTACSPHAKTVEFTSQRSPQTAPAPALKRKLDFVYKDGDEADKRVKIAGDMDRVGHEDGPTGTAGEAMDALDDAQSHPDDSTPSSRRDSIFDTTANDTLNTIMTEADDEVVVAAPHVPLVTARRVPEQAILTPEQARSTATALRLRLQLSMYKIRTNQISVPLNQLSIIPRYPKRNTSFTSHPLTQPPQIRAHARSQSSSIMYAFQQDASHNRRTTLPATRSPLSSTLARPKSANAALVTSKQTRDELREGGCELRETASASPELRSSPVKMGFATPVLPRRREGTFSSVTYGRGRSPDLTSSVVKGRAADGLLKLMGGA